MLLFHDRENPKRVLLGGWEEGQREFEISFLHKMEGNNGEICEVDR